MRGHEMNRASQIILFTAFAIAWAIVSAPLSAQSAPASRVPGDMRQDLADFVETPADRKTVSVTASA